MIEIDTTLLFLLALFACIGFLLAWIHFLNFAFNLGRKREERRLKTEKMNQNLENILKKLDEKL